MTQSIPNPRELIVIDSRVIDWQLLAGGISRNADVLILDPARDGLLQIAEAVQGYSGLDAIHIVSHGSEGSLLLGSTRLSNANLTDYSGLLSTIGAALNEKGDILLYGCDVAKGDHGQAFIEQLAALTGADLAASNDLTGAAAQGGDWVLEAQTGTIEAAPAFNIAAQTEYAGTLSFTASGGGNGITSSSSNVTFAEYYPELGSDLSISSLLGAIQWGDHFGAGTAINLTTSFSTSASVYGYTDIATSGMQALTAVQINAARVSMNAWAAVANITFTETTDSATNAGDIRWGQTANSAVSTAYAYLPYDMPMGGDIWFGPKYSSYYQNPVLGSYGYQTYLHELGHALGLGHPHEGYTSPEPGEDQLKYSVMSYRSYADAPLTGYTTRFYPTSPMLNDILAIQYLYGANTCSISLIRSPAFVTSPETSRIHPATLDIIKCMMSASMVANLAHSSRTACCRGITFSSSFARRRFSRAIFMSRYSASFSFICVWSWSSLSVSRRPVETCLRNVRAYLFTSLIRYVPSSWGAIFPSLWCRCRPVLEVFHPAEARYA